MANFIYGWKRDLPDHRDFKFTYDPIQVENLPKSIDLRADMPPIYDQGALGSCTANAGGAAFEYRSKVENKPLFMPSRLFIYYNERRLDRTVSYDAGSSIRCCMKVLNQYGTMDESLWPYDITQFKKKPQRKIYREARKNRVDQYLVVRQDLASIKYSLSKQLPVVFGFAVYESFETVEVARTGMMPMPSATESCLGGHAVVMAGYDDDKKCFIVRNSWGSGWGDKGYFYMPYEYALNPNLSSDFWTIQVV